MAFPQTLDNFTNPTPSTPTNSPVTPLSGQLSQLNNAVEAIEGVIGVTGSTVPTSLEYRLADVQAVAAGAADSVTEAAHLAMHNTLRLPTWPTWGTATGQRFKLSNDDTIDASADTCVLITTSSNLWESGIGRTSAPAGAPGTNSDPAAGVDATKGLPWVADSGYVVGAADVCTIVGGYDHTANQIAGTIVGGGHNYIQYHLDGHSVIVGGSNNRIAGGRGAIVGALNATITLDSNHGSVFGGRGGTVTNHFSAIVGGDANLVSGTYAFVGAGLTNSCGAHNAAILAGQTNTITVGATGACVAAGLSNSVGAAASYSLCSGRSNTVSHTLATVLGRDATSDADGALTIGKAKLLTVGDQQTTIHTMGIRTTDTTLTNLVTALTPPAVKMAFGIHAQIVGINESTGAVAAFSYDGIAAWDGASQATFYDVGGSGTTRNFTQIVDGIGCAAVPLWAGNVTIRPKVTGKAATNIKWSCTAIFTVTRL